ncbi:hypothetical protein F4811DRAFT_568998 [Daldinia bambusicola]|nr:hypothetical protein F4811DRAFT_568998 [Daldinia bambusicola]
MNSITANLQHIQIQQSQTLESLAHAKVENSTFFATPLLEQYKDEFPAGVKRNFQSAARSTWDDILQDAPAAINKMQHRSKTAHRVSKLVANEDEEMAETNLHTPERYKAASAEPSLLSLERPILSQPDRKNGMMLYWNQSERKTRLGSPVITIRDIPSLFQRSFSIAYENKTDARGSPEIGLKWKTYRVIPQDHEVIKSMKANSIRTVQNMLSQKLISPSDRDMDGHLLLMISSNV